MNYEELLNKGIKELPESISSKDRFEVPKVKGHIEGNKTIITNFNQIIDKIRRDESHFLKFLLKGVASVGKKDNDRLILGSKVSSSSINQKIKEYVDKYVICPDCGRPDTKLEKEKDFVYLKCQACGAKHYVR
jgi:translation initiation factor 2 subunit 2